MAEPRIRVLPPHVAEQIAAGEVVEQPASVVKELVENALDAGARRVTVETEAGGKAMLRVTDDGCGMTPEEAVLAVQRHATSKLRSAEDLFNIYTFGFRGEALPSIAAVSEFEILTRPADATEGSRLRVRGGTILEQEPAAAQVGTTITVRRLFFNLPVREKFLRADATEANQITTWMQRLALARPDVSFRLVHNGREALLSPGSQDPLNAVVAILGRQVARDLLRVPPDSGAGEVSVSGFVGRPTLTRANRNLQHFYVNGRAVRSPIFYRALDDAFRATMPQGRYPVAVLFINLPPDQVDVNVHPAKVEVRFLDEAEIHRALYSAVVAALRTEASSANETLNLPEPPPAPSNRMPEVSRVAEPTATFETPTPATPESLPFARTVMNAPPSREWEPSRPAGKSASAGEYDPFDEPGRKSAHRPSPSPSPQRREPGLFGGAAANAVPNLPMSPSPDSAPLWPEASPPGAAVEREVEPETRPSRLFEPPPSISRSGAVPEPEAEPAPELPEFHLLGQSRDLFILAEGGGRLWVIDQHVAHERVLFDRMMSPQAVTESPEPLLIPARLHVDRAQALALDDHRDLLGELGFVIEQFGASTYILRAVPRSLLGRNYETVFRDLADELATRSHGGQVRLRKKEVAEAAAGRSCKSAIKAGQTLSTAEMERLLADLRTARNPHTCPHGRPVFLTFTPEEVAGLFGDSRCS